jgi:hypothetical protein
MHNYNLREYLSLVFYYRNDVFLGMRTDYQDNAIVAYVIAHSVIIKYFCTFQ